MPRVAPLLSLVVLAFGLAAPAQADSSLPFVATRLSDNVLVLTEQSPWRSNHVVITSDRGLVVVDPGGSPAIARMLRQAIANGDPSALRIAAHTLKGSMRYFGSSQVFDRAFRLEKIGQSGNLENAPAAADALEADMARLVPALLDYLQEDPATEDR